MADALSDGDRLPWLDTPRPAQRTPTRRARTPLLVLLALFLASAIAVMAYLTGRGTAPIAAPEPAPVVLTVTPVAPAPAPTLPPTPPPAVPIARPPPVVISPAPLTVTPVRATPAKARVIPAKTKRKASVRRASAKPKARRTARAVVASNPRAVSAPRVAAPPRYRAAWTARPFAGPRGRVIQLGAYRTQAQADAAWWRVARAYPYLTTLPRMVVWIGPTPGRARTYRVRLAASSRREARALCHNLHRIGRGCRIA